MFAVAIDGPAGAGKSSLAKAAAHLDEPELLELKRVYGAQAARRFPPVPQLRGRSGWNPEDETDFLI